MKTQNVCVLITRRTVTVHDIRLNEQLNIHWHQQLQVTHAVCLNNYTCTQLHMRAHVDMCYTHVHVFIIFAIIRGY